MPEVGYAELLCFVSQDVGRLAKLFSLHGVRIKCADDFSACV
jgi:hypothetical protein